MKVFRKGSFLLPIIALVLAIAGGAREAAAEVSVNINIGPPPIVVAEPPAVVMVPQSRVYYVPDIDIDVFFFAGYWWSPRGERWYRGRSYNGPWVHMNPSAVPRAVIYMPRDYRGRYAHERHIPHDEWKKGYDSWEKKNWKAHRHWEKEREEEWKRHKKDERYERERDRSGHRDDDRHRHDRR